MVPQNVSGMVSVAPEDVEQAPTLDVVVLESLSDEEVQQLALGLRERHQLVVFPTETVYGLGANALDPIAVKQIFELKKRPHYDPVICHVSTVNAAFALWTVTTLEALAIRLMAKAFWPGPLSIIAKAAPTVPSLVSGHSGLVSARMPNHPLAIRFLEAAGVPVAAPSANLFGRISPSTSAHVKKNFQGVGRPNTGQEKLVVLGGGKSQIGIESTVCKIEDKKTNLTLSILRRGHISSADLLEVFRSLSKLFIEAEKLTEDQVSMLKNIEVIVPKRYDEVKPSTEESWCSPGMALTHYAPVVPLYLVNLPPNRERDFITFAMIADKKISMSNAVFVDFWERASDLQNCVKKYLNCGSAEDRSAEPFTLIERNLFALLHQAEDMALRVNAEAILVRDIYDDAIAVGERGLAAYDRLYRSASGRRIKIS